MSQYAIRRAAVLGAGVMGSKIAAHLANAGIPSLLLDLAPQELTDAEKRKGLAANSRAVRNRIVEAGWRSAVEARPAALFAPEVAALVTLGNFTDDMPRISEADWIIEAVTERLEVKRALLADVERHRRSGTILSSNTSGIPIHRIAEGFSDDLRRHFLGVHFFNPPRYLRLVEIIPTRETDPELVRFMQRFVEESLGKGAVVCKDTPNFIANRIGIYGICRTLHAMVEDGLTVEEVDALTGPLLGRPRSATFRTADVVGLDTLAHVARNLHESLPDDPEREVFRLPEFVATMIERRWLGEKSGQGFYRRTRAPGRDVIEHLDYRSMEYQPPASPRFREVDSARKIDALERRIRRLVAGRGRASRFLWKVTSATLAYAAGRIPEIADDIAPVDNAMKWGFGHQLGPFETLDAIGVERAAARLRDEGRPVPVVVDQLLASRSKSFYKRRAGRPAVFVPDRGEHVRIEEPSGVLVLSNLKARKKVVRESAAASLVDLGDGVACLEFHTKANAIGADVIRAIGEAIEEVGRNFVGLVIANEGENFSAGANLVELLGAARAGQWDAIEQMVRAFQQVNQRLRYSDKPVVAAPHQRALAGGCEIVLHCDTVHAAAELYIGFVEVGVGLIPGAGGCKEMVVRAACEAGSDADVDLFPRVRKRFETVATAKVSQSAVEARAMGLLRARDHIGMNEARRIHDAKADVLELAREGYRPGAPRADIPVLGSPGLASLKLGLHMMARAGYISEYDRTVGTRLAEVMTGGTSLGVRRVTESYLLDLEREAFLRLAGEPKTQERIEHMLREGKPLRN